MRNCLSQGLALDIESENMFLFFPLLSLLSSFQISLSLIVLMAKGNINLAIVFHKQAVEFYLPKPMHWNNSDRLFPIFPGHSHPCDCWQQTHGTEICFLTTFPLLFTHGSLYLLGEPLPKSITEKADAHVGGKQKPALSFENERRYVVMTSPGAWELSISSQSLLFLIFKFAFYFCLLCLGHCARATLQLPCAGCSLWWLLQLWCTGLVAPRHVKSCLTGDWTRAPFIGKHIPNHWTTGEGQSWSLEHLFSLGLCEVDSSRPGSEQPDGTRCSTENWNCWPTSLHFQRSTWLKYKKLRKYGCFKRMNSNRLAFSQASCCQNCF